MRNINFVLLLPGSTCRPLSYKTTTCYPTSSSIHGNNDRSERTKHFGPSYSIQTYHGFDLYCLLQTSKSVWSTRNSVHLWKFLICTSWMLLPFGFMRYFEHVEQFDKRVLYLFECVVSAWWQNLTCCHRAVAQDPWTSFLMHVIIHIDVSLDIIVSAVLCTINLRCWIH